MSTKKNQPKQVANRVVRSNYKRMYDDLVVNLNHQNEEVDSTLNSLKKECSEYKLKLEDANRKLAESITLYNERWSNAQILDSDQLISGIEKYEPEDQNRILQELITAMAAQRSAEIKRAENNRHEFETILKN